MYKYLPITSRTPAFWGYLLRPMITHIIDSYWISSQNKAKSELQIKKKCPNLNILNFEKETLDAAHFLKVFDTMDTASIVENTDWTRFSPQTDRRTDGRADRRARWNQYTPPTPSTSWSWGYNELTLIYILLQKQYHTENYLVAVSKPGYQFSQ